MKRLVYLAASVAVSSFAGCSLILGEDPPDEVADAAPSEDASSEYCEISSCESFVVRGRIDPAGGGRYESIQEWINDRRGDFPARHKIAIEPTAELPSGRYESSCIAGDIAELAPPSLTELVLLDVTVTDASACSGPIEFAHMGTDAAFTYLGHLGVGAIEEGVAQAGTYPESLRFNDLGTTTTERAFWRLRPAEGDHHLGAEDAGVLLSPGEATNHAVIIEQPFTEIIGIALTNFGAPMNQRRAGFRVSADGVFLDQLLIYRDGGPGLSIGIEIQSDNVVVANTIVRETSGRGITVGQQASATLVNSTVYQCSLVPPTAAPGGCVHATPTAQSFRVFNTISLATDNNTEGFAGISPDSSTNITSTDEVLGAAMIKADPSAVLDLSSLIPLAQSAADSMALSYDDGIDGRDVVRSIESEDRSGAAWDIGARVVPTSAP